MASRTKSAVLEDTTAPEIEDADAARQVEENTDEAQEDNTPYDGDLQKLKNKLRNASEREVLNNHRDEFHQIATRKFAEHGLKFEPRPSESEKAAKKMEALLKEHPELAERFAPKGEPVTGPAE